MNENGKPLLSVCIPAHNEEGNIGETIDTIRRTLLNHNIPHEFVIANDNSTDGTERILKQKQSAGVPIVYINRSAPAGFGRAVRTCLNYFRGDIVVIVMADLSDDPNDIVKYYDKINEGYDAVYGSRFRRGARVRDYPRIKLIANRLGNKLIQVLFRTSHNDLTNAFKAFRADAIKTIEPLYSSHFNITIEISIGLMIRNYKIASMPINWYGRTWSQSKFKIRDLARRYFATLIKLYAERIFIIDDVMAEHDVKLLKLRTNSLRDEVVTYTDEKNIDNRWSGLCGK